MALPGPADLIAAARDMMACARKDMEDGKPVDLAPFEAHVRKLCDALMALPQSESDSFRSGLEQLVEDLGRLSEEMVRRRDTLRDEIHGISRQAHAWKAYAKAGGVKSSKPEENN